MAKVKTHYALDDTQGTDQECKHVEEMLTANNPSDRFVQPVVRRRERQSENQPSELLGERRHTCYISIPIVMGKSEAVANS